MFYVTTTSSPRANEGYSEKADYPHGVIRYRKTWTREELIGAISEAGLTVYAECYNHESDWDKNWFNVWTVKPDTPNERRHPTQKTKKIGFGNDELR